MLRVQVGQNLSTESVFQGSGPFCHFGSFSSGVRLLPAPPILREEARLMEPRSGPPGVDPVPVRHAAGWNFLTAGSSAPCLPSAQRCGHCPSPLPRGFPPSLGPEGVALLCPWQLRTSPQGNWEGLRHGADFQPLQSLPLLKCHSDQRLG